MIVLDTNVISELLRAKPDSRVALWAHTADSSTLHTTAITEAELLAGIALMPSGRRRDDLTAALARIFAEAFPARVLPFTSAAAPHYAAIVARRTVLGRPISQANAQIAALCRLHNAVIATRDAMGFEELEIDVISPWTD